MSRINNKRNVFSDIKAFSSKSGNKPEVKDSYSSVNNSKDCISFMLDVLKAIAGTEALKFLIGSFLVDILNNSESQLKSGLKKQFVQSNADNSLPEFDVNVKVKTLDSKKKLKVLPTDEEKGGNLLYGDSNNNGDRMLRNAINNPSSNIPCHNTLVNYNPDNDSFLLKPIDVNVGDYFNNFIDNTNIINSDEIVGELSIILRKHVGEESAYSLPSEYLEALFSQVRSTELSKLRILQNLSAVQQYAGETGEYVVTDKDVKLAKDQEAVINERMTKLESSLTKYVALEETITETVAPKQDDQEITDESKVIYGLLGNKTESENVVLASKYDKNFFTALKAFKNEFGKKAIVAFRVNKSKSLLQSFKE